MKIRITVIFLVLLMVSILPITTQQPTPSKTATFVLSSWDYPDEYEQGIDNLKFYENSTGSWVAAPYYIDGLPYYSLDHDTASFVLNWSVGVAMKIRVSSLFNQTLVGVESTAEGQNYLKHAVTVKSAGQEVFSQQNFTYYDVIEFEEENYYYKYEVILNFLPLEGAIYTIDLTYDIFYEQSESYYLNDGSSLSGIEIYSHGGLSDGEYGIESDGAVIESWIMPDDSGDENTIYRFNFTDIDNTNSEINVSIRYKIEATTGFSYLVVYNDTTADISTLGLSTSWTTLNVTCDTKFLDYIQFYNSDFPNSVASGNLSAWIDYIEIERAYDAWQETSEVTFYFEVPISAETLWAINGWYMLFGAVLVISSGSYAALKIRAKDYNSNLCFWPIVAFFIGWALILGVIS